MGICASTDPDVQLGICVNTTQDDPDLAPDSDASYTPTTTPTKMPSKNNPSSRYTGGKGATRVKFGAMKNRMDIADKLGEKAHVFELCIGAYAMHGIHDGKPAYHNIDGDHDDMWLWYHSATQTWRVGERHRMKDGTCLLQVSGEQVACAPFAEDIRGATEVSRDGPIQELSDAELGMLEELIQSLGEAPFWPVSSSSSVTRWTPKK